ncbi:MAG: A/G-specific adenine glycosylase [Casimicrobiaceae bacterium]
MSEAASAARAVPIAFADRVVAWHATHGRHDLPWQTTRDPYRIWLSEVMLQQTQVTAVIPYYHRFLEALPDVGALARAPLDVVLGLWSGLGYYRRARHLHEAAQVVMREHQGRFPRDADAIAALPGVGRSTAAAIAAFAFGTRGAILDGNVKRVFARHRGVEGFPGEPRVARVLWAAAESVLPACDIEAYTQAMMDLGATVCVRHRPRCERCPVAEDCIARLEQRVTALPTPRPNRTLPERSVRMLVLDAGGAVLLERRGTTGVWGGLWSLPELTMESDVRSVCASRYAVVADAAACEPLAPIDHAFTHFRLTIHPVHVRLARAPEAMDGSDRAWVEPGATRSLGIPAPVRRLLERLYDPRMGQLPLGADVSFPR